MTEKRKRIVIVGGNFAGLTAAIKLSRQHAVTVIDPSRHFEWMPNIHEILSSVKTPHALRLDRAAIVAQAGHRFVRDRVTLLQPAQHRLTTAGGRELGFDACIVAMGALWNTHHIPGVARHAMPFRSVADALAIERRLRTVKQQGKPLRIVIAGGGISGIEALGEILRRHRDDAGLSVEVIEAGPRLLPGLPASLDADLRRLCAPYAVSFRTATTIAGVTAKSVRLSDGTRLRSELTLWTAGLSPPPLLRESGLARPPEVWASVEQTLRSRHFDNTFVVGDAAQLPQPVGKQAYNAIDMGALAAANVTRHLSGRCTEALQAGTQAGADRVRRPADLPGRGPHRARQQGVGRCEGRCLSAVHVADGARRRAGFVARRVRAAVAELASARQAAVVVVGGLQEHARPQGHQAAVGGRCAAQSPPGPSRSLPCSARRSINASGATPPAA